MHQIFQFHKGTIKTHPLTLSVYLSTYFNSIKVRLKHILKVIISTHKPIFQFHKGTIKTQILQLLCIDFNHFNSIKVRLKHSEYKVGHDVLRFQFHKGTIKTNLDTFNMSHYLFQFHKGTIKTRGYRAVAVVDYHFNSIKVRLKLAHFTFSALQQNFNSIKVRLKLPLIGLHHIS